MKKIIMSVALGVLASPSSWSSNFEPEDRQGKGSVFDSRFELREERDKNESPDSRPEAKKTGKKDPTKHTPSAPIFIEAPKNEIRTYSGSLPTTLDPSVASSFEPSSFMESFMSESFKPGSYESHLKEEERRRTIKALSDSFSKKKDSN